MSLLRTSVIGALALVLTVGLVIGVAGGYWWGNAAGASLAAAVRSSLLPIQDKSSPFKLVRPLLGYKTPEAIMFGEYTDLNDALQANIDTALQATGVTRIAVYFRDLDTARWVGINQSDLYHPASLLKVPLMMTYYKEAELNPSILNDVLTYHTFSNLPPFEAPSKLVVGQSYTVEELINKMIINSDNGATFMLLEHIDSDSLNATYTALGVAVPGAGNATDYQISARSYGLFFRILYNATYLSPEYSQKALQLLSIVDFPNGLRAGLPLGTLVAQKYGEHVVATGMNVTGVELSDCGVVYYPAHPYLLCVMTSAKDETTAANVIRMLSKTTYDEFSKQYPQK